MFKLCARMLSDTDFFLRRRQSLNRSKKSSFVLYRKCWSIGCCWPVLQTRKSRASTRILFLRDKKSILTWFLWLFCPSFVFP